MWIAERAWLGCLKSISGFFSVLFLFATVSVYGADLDTEFAAANKLYEQGKFQEAATAYERLIKSAPPLANLHYNLGNAWLKAQRYGLAITEFRRAALLNPRDADIRANLALARTKIQKPAPPEPIWVAVVGHLRLKEWLLMAGISTWIWAASLCLVRWGPKSPNGLRNWIPALAGLAVILVILAGVAVIAERANPVGVVVTKETKARYGPLEESKELLGLTDGTEVRVLQVQGNWANVEIPGLARPGWVSLQHLVVFR
jgi:tetratricopeptide (TPR) repeat protein